MPIMADETPIAPNTKRGAGEAPHAGWQNRDYSELDETTPSGSRRWLQFGFVLMMSFGLIGLLWNGVIQPLLK